MTFAKGMKRYGWWGKFKEEKLEEAKKILGHVGLFCYTAFGGFMFQILEHPYEKDFLQTLQDLVMVERLNLKNMIYNLTSNLTDDELDLLYNYADCAYDSLDAN